MTNYYRYPLNGTLKPPLESYRAKFNLYPLALVVNPKNVEQARQMIADLGLETEVTTSGGCLANEVWLSEPDNEHSNDNGAAPIPVQPSLF